MKTEMQMSKYSYFLWYKCLTSWSPLNESKIKHCQAATPIDIYLSGLILNHKSLAEPKLVEPKTSIL